MDSSPTFRTYTFGCRVNQAETIEIERSLQKVGFQPVKDGESPDIFIINTCVVTQKAERQVRQLLRKIKRENVHSFLVLCGCAVNFWQRFASPKPPQVLFIKNEDKRKISQILKEKFSPQENFRKPEVVPLDNYQKSGRLIIKIQDGCDQYCKFCIVPYLRRKLKSKRIAQIVREVKKAEKEGIKEIILSGINLGLYGKDTNETLTNLLQNLLKQTSIPRLSFGSIYPEAIDEKFLEIYKKDWQSGPGRLCHFFHLPLQSGSEKILKLMGRKYNLKKFKLIVEAINKDLPKSFIATDIIVGFPGEGKKEFEETITFLESLPIHKYHLFRFSQRPGTPAALMEKKEGVMEKEKVTRLRLLKLLEEEKWQEFAKRILNHTFSTLFLKKENGLWIGLTSNMVKVRVFDNKVLRKDIKPVRIFKVDGRTLYGKISKTGPVAPAVETSSRKAGSSVLRS